MQQIVITKQPDGKIKVATMGLDDRGQGVTLGTYEGTQKDARLTVDALLTQLEAPK